MSEANPHPGTHSPQPTTPIFLTGATGFIGRRLAKRLVAAGADVAALVLPGETALLPDGVRALTGDVTIPETVTEAIATAQPALIIHLAAVGITNPDLPFTAACDVNVGGVINILDAARHVEAVRRIVMVGSS